MCGQHNVRAIAGDNKGQNTDQKPHTQYRLKIKISDPWESNRNTTDHAKATDILHSKRQNLAFKHGAEMFNVIKNNSFLM